MSNSRSNYPSNDIPGQVRFVLIRALKDKCPSSYSISRKCKDTVKDYALPFQVPSTAQL